MGRQQTVINLDPIDRKKRKGPFSRLLITRWKGGPSVKKDEPFGHYMFCGPQGSGKTSSALWYANELGKKYTRKGYKCRLFSNFGAGQSFDRKKIFELISNFDPYAKEVRIVIVDEMHTYFPKDSVNKETRELRDKMTNIFSQLRKRNTFILSTAQIYGRLDKALREQCLYMIDCKVNYRSKLVNDFIKQENILCDDLGRWAGEPSKIYVHGLSKVEYDTKRIIME